MIHTPVLPNLSSKLVKKKNNVAFLGSKEKNEKGLFLMSLFAQSSCPVSNNQILNRIDL